MYQIMLFFIILNLISLIGDEILIQSFLYHLNIIIPFILQLHVMFLRLSVFLPIIMVHH